jgi:hypothetical protein
MESASKQKRLVFDRLVEAFRNEVIERRGRGATELEMYALLADTEKAFIDQGWDDGTRILVMEKFRAVVREVYR